MSESFMPQVGGILSADIAVPEHEREMRFYSRVLCTGGKPLWRDDLMNSLGMPIVGLGARTADHAVLPQQWMPHIQVADVAASAKRALELGGRELMHGKNEGGESQWAVLLDPNGAAFGLIPVAPADYVAAAKGADAATGRIAWLDLTVAADVVAATRDFYCEVVGWSARGVAMKDAGEGYVDFCLHGPGGPGEAMAGICHARGVNQEVPPVWMLYLPVGDLSESVRLVEEEGGKVLKSTRGKDGKYAYAWVQDPVGACLVLAASS
ncbi:MAG: VOC family protein [Planctomycetota bacterium]